MRVSQKNYGWTIPSLEIQPRCLGILCQCFCYSLPGIGVYLLVLSSCPESDTSVDELGNHDIWRRSTLCDRILRREGPT